MRLFVALCLGLLFTITASAQPGPEIQSDNRVKFRFRANQAKEVAVRGQWSKVPIALSRQEGENSIWTVTSEPIPAGVWEYRFVVDGLTVIDPSNPMLKPQREPNSSILHIEGSPPNPWDFKNIPHGTVHQHSYYSKTLGRHRELSVYTPPGYENKAESTYPLLVLQHGSGDNHLTWVAHGKAHWILDSLIAEQKAVPMIVLMIDGHPRGQVPRDDVQARDESLTAFEKELFGDAIPLVEANYRVSSDRELRGIAGLSMGGWQSINVGFSHLNQFAWIGSFSGAADKATLETTLSDAETTNKQTKLLWIACGKDDFLLDRIQALIDALEEHHIHHEWHLTDGDHSWPVWRVHLNDFLPRLFQK